jgi:drug/metabolite transporter (DMT)-like permease
MLIGVFAGIMTGALWGLTFVAARAVEPYSAWDITIARYGFFGLLSLVLMIAPRFQPRGMSARLLACGLALGAISYTAYFLAVAYAVKNAGAAIPPLVVGTMPVVMALIGNVSEKAVRWRDLAFPLGLIAVGVLTVNGAAVAQSSFADRQSVLVGTGWAVLALATWVAYGAANAAVMRGPNPPTSLRWTCLQGIGALVGSAALLPLTRFLTQGAAADLVTTPDGIRFLAWAVVMGIGGSWFAAWAWIVASQRLPLAFAAQLVVFETIFGLIDGFILEQRWPSTPEWIGSGLQLVGVAAGVWVFTRPRPAPMVTARPRPRAC